MEMQLGLLSIRLPAPEAGLAELATALPPASGSSSPAEPEALQLDQVAAWTQLQLQKPITALDWAGLHTCLAGSQKSGGKACQHLVSLLGWAAAGAVQQLRAAGEVRAAVFAASDAGNPRQLGALRNTLKLSLAYLACMARASGCASGGAGQREQLGIQQGKKAKAGGASEGKAGAAAAVTLSNLHLRRDALLQLGAIAEAVSADGGTLMPAVAERLWRAAALHCLVEPPAGGTAGSGAASVSAKAAADACFGAAAGGCSAFCQKVIGGCCAFAP